ncbi:MAG TPA: zinc ribbon domain-containing protein [Anaerolineales bacterium]
MDATQPSNELQCPQCGGVLHPEEGQTFLTCPYCGASVYLDRSQVVFHWYLTPTLDEAKARAALAGWMAGNQTVKDLDQKAKVLGSSFEYFPVWFFKVRLPTGSEQVLLEPAAATSVSELRNLNLPAGDLRKYENNLDAQSHAPNVPLQTARSWAENHLSPQSTVAEQSLVHIPLYTFKYTYRGSTYTAIVEAGTGGVFANIYPAKAEAPFLVAGGITALVFLCLATFPLIGSTTRGGAGVGLLACVGAGAVAAPLLFALAAWVAAKI